MRISILSLRRTSATTRIPNKFYSTMSVSEFVAAAEKADSSLKGSSEKDQQAIQKLSTESESLAKDIKVSESFAELLAPS